MTKRLVKKSINAPSMTWTAPANVTRVTVSVYDDFNLLCNSLNSGSAFLKSNGQIWTCGLGSLGKLGDGTIASKSSPVAVIGGHSFIRVSGGDGCSALKADGSVWTWGDNGNGQLGDGTIANKSSPVPVIGGHSFVSISTGKIGYNLALKSNGTIWGWGGNSVGQLGDGTIANKSSPIALIGGHSFIQISAGGGVSSALKSDGSVWTWGDNSSGQLGDGTNVNKSSPVAVIGGHSFLHTATAFSSVLGLKSDGSIWMWGSNTWGLLGDGTVINKSSPVQVIGGHSFVQAVLGSGTSAAALKSDGSVWTWGLNGTRQLGDGTSVTSRSSPVPVIGGHSFINISAAQEHFSAIKSDGTVWGWGSNTIGQLGDGTNVSKSSPVQAIGGHLFEAGSIFINRFILEVTPGTTYNIDFFLTQIGSLSFRNFNARNNIEISLEYYV